MKICIVCGNTVEDKTRECPNCGSYDFKSVETKDIDPRFKQWKYK